MNFLDAINQVLLRLRESDVSTWTATNYTKLIGQLVNEAKREVEDAHQWNALKETVSGSISATDTSVVFSGTSSRTRILSVYNTTNDDALRLTPRETIIRWRQIGNASAGKPWLYSLKGYDANGNIELELWPESDAAYDLLLDCINPQDNLESNNTVISVPTHPVTLRATALALAERGDDQGQSFSQLMREYQIALNDAVVRDDDNGGHINDWVVM